MKKRPTPSSLQALYNQCQSLRVLSVHLGVSYTTAQVWCMRSGVRVRRNDGFHPLRLYLLPSTIPEMLDEPLSREELVREMGMTPGEFSRVLKNM